MFTENTEEAEKMLKHPITLIIDKTQASTLGLALKLLPLDLSMEQAMSMGEKTGSVTGGMLGMMLLMLSKIIDKDEQDILIEALNTESNYTNSKLDVEETVPMSDYKELLALVMKTYGNMYVYYQDTEEQVTKEDAPVFDLLIKAHKIIR